MFSIPLTQCDMTWAWVFRVDIIIIIRLWMVLPTRAHMFVVHQSRATASSSCAQYMPYL